VAPETTTAQGLRVAEQHGPMMTRAALLTEKHFRPQKAA